MVLSPEHPRPLGGNLILGYQMFNAAKLRFSVLLAAAVLPA